MCGVNGIYNFSVNEQRSTDLKSLEAMNLEMQYRGPDGQGFWQDDRVSMSMVRLSIIGLEDGQQPFHFEEKKLTWICNGEIYNYLELKDLLEAKGYKFKTHSDCEVIAYLYDLHGEDFVDYLEGMFAIILWDGLKEELFVVRDRVGLKPLYYSVFSDKIVISSELKTIQKVFKIKNNYDYKIINDIANNSYPIDRKKTINKEILRVEPGQFLKVTGSKVEKKTYWQLPQERTVFSSQEEIDKQVLQYLEQAIEKRLRSDVPVAIMLSGGVDSSAIACIAQKFTHEVNVISVGYEGDHDCDERNQAKRLSDEKGFKWHEVTLGEFDYEKAFEDYLNYLDEPIGDVAAIANWALYKKIRELGFKVVLNGTGGDELFFGYEPHNKAAEAYEFINKLIMRIKGKGLKRLCLEGPWFLKNSKKILHNLRNYRNIYNFEAHALSEKKFDGELNSVGSFSQYYARDRRDIDNFYHRLFNVWLPNNCLFLADKLGMGNSVEVRCPFTDHTLIDYVFSVDLDLIYTGEAKAALKRVLRGTVPSYILDAPKRGFTPPEEFISLLSKTEKYQVKVLKEFVQYD